MPKDATGITQEDVPKKKTQAQNKANLNNRYSQQTEKLLPGKRHAVFIDLKSELTSGSSNKLTEPTQPIMPQNTEKSYRKCNTKLCFKIT